MKTTRAITITALGAATLVACGGSDSGGSTDSFCDSVVELDESGVSPDTDPDAAAQALRDLAGEAPSEIKDEFESFSAVLDAVVSEDPEALANIDFEEMESDITTIGEYIGENCEGVGNDVFDL